MKAGMELINHEMIKTGVVNHGEGRKMAKVRTRKQQVGTAERSALREHSSCFFNRPVVSEACEAVLTMGLRSRAGES